MSAFTASYLLDERTSKSSPQMRGFECFINTDFQNFLTKAMNRKNLVLLFDHKYHIHFARTDFAVLSRCRRGDEIRIVARTD